MCYIVSIAPCVTEVPAAAFNIIIYLDEKSNPHMYMTCEASCMYVMCTTVHQYM